MNVSKTYSIRDVLLYRATLPTGENTIDISQADIPTNFKATFKVKQLSTYSSMAGVYIGSHRDNSILFGKIGSEGHLGIYVYKNGLTVISKNLIDVYQNNQVIETVYIYDEGVQTVIANNTTISLTNSDITARTYLSTRISSSEITDLIIEPL